jgi:hypothetical protein
MPSCRIANAKRRAGAAFEFMSKLGVHYYTFHDRDVAPEGRDLAETNAHFDEVWLGRVTSVLAHWHMRVVCSGCADRRGFGCTPEGHGDQLAVGNSKPVFASSLHVWSWHEPTVFGVCSRRRASEESHGNHAQVGW